MASKVYWVTFEVCGKHSFPFDMLRFDQCFPSRSEDAARIADCELRDAPRSEKLAKQPEGFYRIRLVRMTRAAPAPTFGRWQSFGWSVDPETVQSSVM